MEDARRRLHHLLLRHACRGAFTPHPPPPRTQLSHSTLPIRLFEVLASCPFSCHQEPSQPSASTPSRDLARDWARAAPPARPFDLRPRTTRSHLGEYKAGFASVGMLPTLTLFWQQGQGSKWVSTKEPQGAVSSCRCKGEGSRGTKTVGAEHTDKTFNLACA
jgi:hypothetical protein